MDVLLSRVDLRQELLEELEAPPEPQQSLGGRVAHLSNLRMHLVQHNGLQRGEAGRVRHQFLIDLLQAGNENLELL